MSGAVPPPYKHSHAATWFLGIMTMLLLVFIVAAGIYLYQEKANETANAGAANDQITQLQADLTRAQSHIAELESPEETLERYDGSSIWPAFNYQTGWHIIARDYVSGVRYHIQASPRPIFQCSACDGNDAPVYIWTFLNDGSTSVPTYDDPNFYEDVTTETKIFSNGTLTHITGFRKPALSEGADFEAYIFEGNTYIVQAYFEDKTGSTASNPSEDLEGWITIRESLDFSAIE